MTLLDRSRSLSSFKERASTMRSLRKFQALQWKRFLWTSIKGVCRCYSEFVGATRSLWVVLRQPTNSK